MITLIISLIVVSAFAKSIQDLIMAGKIFKGHKFWGKGASVNKWKNGDKTQGEAFPLSSTVFVFVTDGWHLSQTVRTWALWPAIAIGAIYAYVALPLSALWLVVLVVSTFGIMIYNTIFELFLRLNEKLIP